MNCESQKIVIDSFSPPTPPKEYLLLYGVNPLWNIREMSTQYRVVSKEAIHDNADFSCLFILLNLFVMLVLLSIYCGESKWPGIDVVLSLRPGRFLIWW